MSALRIATSIDICDTPASVWNALWGSQSWPRVFKDLVYVEVEPPGIAVKGQRFHYVRRIGGQDVHFYYQLLDVSPNEGWRGIESSPGLFEMLEDSGRMTSTITGTRVMVDYKIEGIAKSSRLGEKDLRRGLETFWDDAKRLVETNATASRTFQTTSAE